MGTDYAWGYDVRFTDQIVPELEYLGVQTASVRRHGRDDALDVKIVLPNRERALREKVLGLLDAFEESNGFLVTVSPALLFAEDLADA
jgi:hypothetical protein